MISGRGRKACAWHFYWTATSARSGVGGVKWAKFESFFYHVINMHSGLPNKLYDWCCHSDVLKPLAWLTKDNVNMRVAYLKYTYLYSKVSQKLNKPLVLYYRIYSL